METMTVLELELFHKYVQNAQHYLEFGAGASTIYATAQPNLKSITSVESSQGFINNFLMADDAISSACKSGVLQFVVVNIGETGDWGVPVNRENVHLWPNYALTVFNRSITFDLVLIDGRFRVATALASLLSTGEDTVFCIHDFWNRLDDYGILLNFLNVVERADSLGVFKRKVGLGTNLLNPVLKEYLYNYE